MASDPLGEWSESPGVLLTHMCCLLADIILPLLLSRSYPAAVQGPGGEIHIAYTFRRESIRRVRCSSALR